jgi:phosphate transport system permease protein
MVWQPSVGTYGAIPLIFLTFYAGIGCTIVAALIGIPCAIYLSEFADRKIRNIIKPSLEIMAGFPSVIIGLAGIYIVVTTIGLISGPGTGEGILAVWIVVGIMSLPTVASISEDAIRSVPQDLREASLGIGATKWQTVVKVVIPVAIPGILAAVILGMGNAVGETMAAWILIGGVNSPSLSTDLVHSTNLIPPIIAAGATGEGIVSPKALYALGFLLFAIIAAMNLVIRRILKRGPTGVRQNR